MQVFCGGDDLIWFVRGRCAKSRRKATTASWGRSNLVATGSRLATSGKILVCTSLVAAITAQLRR